MRYPDAMRDPGVADRMVLNLDVAPSMLDLCNKGSLGKVHGVSFKQLAQGRETPCRSSWMYTVTTDKEFSLHTDSVNRCAAAGGAGQVRRPDDHFAVEPAIPLPIVIPAGPDEVRKQQRRHRRGATENLSTMLSADHALDDARPATGYWRLNTYSGQMSPATAVPR